MLTYQQAFYQLKDVLVTIYDTHEATAIAHALLEHITGRNKLQRISEKDKQLTPVQELQYNEAEKILSEGAPLQYATGIQWFMGLPFKINKDVLIPRPETEELVQWIIDEWRDKSDLSIIDIGTGSGNIPIALKLQLPQAIISACDVSAEALIVARQNAETFQATVEFFQFDMQRENDWNNLASYDLIISNPPYIPLEEKDFIDKNVREYEPSVALFAPVNDPFFFYKKIAVNSRKHLNKGGAVYCEFHRDFGVETKRIFEENNFEVILRKDMHGNNRMLKAL